MTARRTPSSARGGGFTLVELLVVVAVIGILISVLLPALAGARISAIQMKNYTQLRGLYQGLVTHSNQNDTWYTGIDGNRREWKSPWKAAYDDMPVSGSGISGTFPRVRFYELVAYELTTPESLIHPAEKDPKEPYLANPDPDTGEIEEFDYPHFSYAVNELGWDRWDLNEDDEAYRWAQEEWKNTGSPRTPVIADRLYRIDGGLANQWNAERYIGMYHDNPGKFEVAIVWNDGHTSMSRSAVVQDTSFGPTNNSADNIYSRGHDAQEGNELTGRIIDMDRGTSAKMNAWKWESMQPPPQG